MNQTSSKSYANSVHCTRLGNERILIYHILKDVAIAVKDNDFSIAKGSAF